MRICAMSSSTRRCLGRSSAGCRWLTSGSKAPTSSALCLPATTTSSRSMRSLPPPSAYGSGLDDAPELTEDLRPKHGGRSIVPVGSTAVRDAIKEGQPALGLHGHIHEAKGNTRIGRTLCINPGSSYEQGQLLGAVVNLDGGKKVKRFVLTSG